MFLQRFDDHARSLAMRVRGEEYDGWNPQKWRSAAVIGGEERRLIMFFATDKCDMVAVEYYIGKQRCSVTIDGQAFLSLTPARLLDVLKSNLVVNKMHVELEDKLNRVIREVNTLPDVSFKKMELAFGRLHDQVTGYSNS
jgi:hypothetical protein